MKHPEIRYTERDLAAEFGGARFHPGLMPHVASRFLNEPLTIEPTKLRTILALVGPRFGVTGVPRPSLDMAPTLVRQDRTREYAVVDGVALIPVIGSIVKRNEGGMLADSGLVSLEALRETVATALSDSNVRALLFQFDSFGGEAVGTPETARFLFDARGTKPMWAAVDDAAYSAGYYLASALDRVVLTPTGGVGSIGVIALHVDASEAYAKEGLKITPIFAGDRKADGADYAPLTEEAYTRFQTRVNQIWDLFTGDVGAFRSMPAAKLKSYQALTFYGADAVTAGLADEVMTFDDALTALKSRVAGGPARQQGGTRMSTQKEPGASHTPEQPGAEVISLDAHRKEKDQAEMAAREAERTRAKSIRGLATLARMPKDKASALADKLVDEGVTLEAAQSAFLVAQAECDKIAAGQTEILGHTPNTPTGALPAGFTTPAMKSRESILAGRTAATQMHGRAVAALERAALKQGLIPASEGGF